MDRLTKEQRSKNMRAIRSSNTDIELILRKALWSRGLRYRVNCKGICGTPDIAIKKYKIAVFCDSEFWHGYDWKNSQNSIKTNRDFWIHKIEQNIDRDRKVNRYLADHGWVVLRFWGNEIKKNLESCVDKILEAVEIRRKELEND